MVKASAKSHLLPLLSVVNKRKNYLFYRIFMNERMKMALGCDIRGPLFYSPFIPNHMRMKNLLPSSCHKFSFIADDNINRLTKTHTAFSIPYRHKSFLLLYWEVPPFKWNQSMQTISLWHNYLQTAYQNHANNLTKAIKLPHALHHFITCFDANHFIITHGLNNNVDRNAIS